MEAPRKKQKHFHINKIALLVGLGVLLAALAVLYLVFSNKPPASIPLPALKEDYLLHATTSKNIASITIENSISPPYTIHQKEEGVYELAGYEGLPLDSLTLEEMFYFAANVTAEEKIDSSEGLSAQKKEAFGLDKPSVTVTVTDNQQASWVFSFGNQIPYENLYYFTYQADPAVYAVELGFYDLYNVSPGYLVSIQQPSIHHQRISGVSIENFLLNKSLLLSASQGLAEEDRLFSWTLGSPYDYPGDPEKVSALLESLESLYLGSYIGEATKANLALYGFSPPSARLIIQLEEATIGQVGSQGVFSQQTFPKETLTFDIGQKEDTFVHHVLYNGHIYLVSSLNTTILQAFSPTDYLLKRPALLPLETLTSLKGENLAQNEEAPLVFDILHQQNNQENSQINEEGEASLPAQLSITLNGTIPISSVDFSAAYTTLTQISAAGFLPQGFTPKAPTYRITMDTLSGISRIIELSPYDALHDALTINGTTLFTIRKGELEKTLEALTINQQSEKLP